MYLEKIKSLQHFNEQVIRNTPTFVEETDTFSDLVDNKFDLDVAKKTINQSNETHFNSVEYQAIEYVFQKPIYFQSRFGDGSFPVWHGSLEQITTFYETGFHWYNTVLQDMYYDENKPITVNRSLFNVTCKAILVDLRGHEKKVPELIDKRFDAYKVTQALSKELYTHGQSGIYTQSARHKGGENVAIYNKKHLSHAEYVKNVSYIYDYKANNIKVIDHETGNMLLKL